MVDEMGAPMIDIGGEVEIRDVSIVLGAFSGNTIGLRGSR